VKVMAGSFLIGAAVLSVSMVDAPLTQHLPDRLQATGKPEHVLAGIDVYRTLPTDLSARLGPTVKTEVFNGDRALGWESTHYWWLKTGVRLRVATQSFLRNGAPPRVRLSDIDVWGPVRGPNRIGVTGAGLGLGDSMARVVRCYGSRLSVDGGSEGTTVVIQWPDGTSLTVDLDKGGRIVHIQLSARE
jgi:hypothetical protein